MSETEAQKRQFYEDMKERMGCHVQQVHGLAWAAAKMLVNRSSTWEEWEDDDDDAAPVRSRSPVRPIGARASRAASSSGSQGIIGGAPRQEWSEVHNPHLHHRVLYDVTGSAIMVDLSYSTRSELRLVRNTINQLFQDGMGRS